MSGEEAVYEIYNIIELYSGEKIKTKPIESEYNFTGNIGFNREEEVSDVLVNLDLGGDSTLSVRASDVRYIKKVVNKKEISGDELDE